MENLIIVKQLPIIEENLKSLSVEIDKKVENAMKLVCTEETLKSVKEVRIDLNKQFKTLEDQRKLVKKRVMQPYENFEEVYKEYVSIKFKKADNDLKQKIENVESDLKQQKENEVREYFYEYRDNLHIDFIEYENANINITLSASKKSLKEQAKAFVDKTDDDLKLIESQEHQDEILVEYMKHLNVSKAITDVKNRYIVLERVKKAEEKREDIKAQEEQNIQRVEETLKAPNVIDEQKYQITFSVTGTKHELTKLKKFLEDGGYKYDSK